MDKIAICNYNNYYNRLFKYSTDYNDYGVIATFPNINFVRADGISTVLTVNLPAAFAEVDPDYLLVLDPETNAIKSRWFVLESYWNRERQLLLSLRRDIIVDSYIDNHLGDAKIYVEKSTIPGVEYNNLAYNAEGQTFNQILQSRNYLKPSANASRYLLGYVDRTWEGGHVADNASSIFAKYEDPSFFPLNDFYTGKVAYADDYTPVFADVTLVKAPMSRWEEYATSQYYCKLHLAFNEPLDSSTDFIDAGLDPNQVGLAKGFAGCDDASFIGNTSTDLPNYAYGVTFDTSTDPRWRRQIYTYVDSVPTYAPNGAKIQSAPSDLLDWDGRYITYGGRFCQIHISTTTSHIPLGDVADSDLYYSIIGRINDTVNATLGHNVDIWVSQAAKSMSIYFEKTIYTITLDFSGGTAIPSSREHLAGGLPYDILVAEDSDEARYFMSQFASQFAGGNVLYDCQLLPFAPPVGETGKFSYGSTTFKWATKDYAYGNLVGAPSLSYPTNSDKKRGSNLDMCRIYSPDGASCWEFNPAKIGGVNDSTAPLKYECTFAPLSVYMHIFPTFGGIYGNVNKAMGMNQQGESRGLICSGDYSLPYSTNNWATYQLQNSAYQLAHERSMNHMFTELQAERYMEEWNMMASPINSFMGGLAAGGANVIGGVAGGILAASSDYATKQLQFQINDQLRYEELSYAEDMFGYQMQNIRAQAQPLAHSNYLTIGVAYFPYIEYYKATSIEETVFMERLETNGWSLGFPSTFEIMKVACEAATAPTRFLKSKLIYTMDTFKADAHVLQAICDELDKGLRFGINTTPPTPPTPPDPPEPPVPEYSVTIIRDDVTANSHGTVSFDADEFLAAIQAFYEDESDWTGDFSFEAASTTTWLTGWWNNPTEGSKVSLTGADGVDMADYGIDITETVPHNWDFLDPDAPCVEGDYIVVRVTRNT